MQELQDRRDFTITPVIGPDATDPPEPSGWPTPRPGPPSRWAVALFALALADVVALLALAVHGCR